MQAKDQGVNKYLESQGPTATKTNTFGYTLLLVLCEVWGRIDKPRSV